MAVEVHGVVEAPYQAVAEAFAQNFARFGEVGAAFCLYVAGRPVVDVWGGAAGAGEWREDTTVVVHSTTKGLAAVCVHLLVERGELDLDAPIADYWPEFAAEDKQEVPVRWVLSHQAGLPAFDEVLTLEDVLAVHPVTAALAAQRPYWKPGSAHGYHVFTFGWLVGELVRRLSGQTIGQFFARQIAAPLGLDCWIGLPESEESRVAPLLAFELPNDSAIQARLASLDRNSLAFRSGTLNGALPLLPDERVALDNSREFHATEMPASNGVTTARSLARLYAALVGDVDGLQLLKPSTIADATVEQACGPDAVIGLESRFGNGFMLNGSLAQMLSDASFGHPGSGGSFGFADKDAGIGFGYVLNKMGTAQASDPRAVNLIEAVRTCL